MIYLLIISCLPSSSKSETTEINISMPEITISPEEPSSSDDLYCNILQPQNNTTYRYYWYANNRDVDYSGQVLPSSLTKWEDSWTCVVFPYYEAQLGPSSSKQISIHNDCTTLYPFEENIFTINRDNSPHFCSQYNAIIGDVLIKENNELFDCLCDVDGDILLYSYQENALNFPKLEHISGSIQLYQNFTLENLLFPMLEHIEENLNIYKTTLHSFSAKKLETIGNISIQENSFLEQIFTPKLRDIRENLFLANNVSLQYFSEDIETIGGNLSVEENHSLSEIPGFQKLSSANNIQIHNNRSVQNIEFLNLEELNASISIQKNDALKNIYFPRIETLPKEFNVQKNILLSIISLPNVETINNFLFITENPSLQQIEMPDLHTVMEDITLRDLEALENIEWNIRHIEGGLRLDNIAIQTLNTTNLVSVSDTIILRENPHISFVSFSSLSDMNGGFDIIGNDSLSEIQFPHFQYFYDDIRISYNLSLLSLSLNIQNFWGDILLQGNSNLNQIILKDFFAPFGSIAILDHSTLSHIAIAETTSIDDSLIIKNNPALSNISLDSLQRIQGALLLENLPSLASSINFLHLKHIDSLSMINVKNISSLPFPALETLGGSLYLENLTDVENLTGSPSLQHIGNHLSIINNPSLNDIQTLYSLQSIRGDITIEDNPNLPNSQAVALPTQLSSQYTGQLTTNNNASN